MGLYMGGVSSFTSQVKEDVYDSLRDYLEGNEKLRIPSTVTSFRRRCFCNCEFKSFVIPEGIITLEHSCFSRCPNLEEITIPNTVTTIGRSCFEETPLKEVYIPESVTSIDDGAFEMCEKLTKITINKPTDSISGAPWGAYNATVEWIG